MYWWYLLTALMTIPPQYTDSVLPKYEYYCIYPHSIKATSLQQCTVVGLFMHEIAFVVFLKAFLTPMASEDFPTSSPIFQPDSQRIP